MRFLVLGPLEVVGDRGDPLPVTGSKERTILAFLIARAGLVVSIDDLIDELWGDQPPRTAEKTLGSYISRLRRALEAGHAEGSPGHLIVARGDGYELQVAAGEVDAIDFEKLAGDGRRLLAAGDGSGAASTLDEALRLWRGDAYQGLRYTGFGASEGDRLDELRRSALEDRVDARMAIGADGTLVAELEGLVREAPLRERRWGQLMVSLYRAGRQAEALDAYRRARDVLVEELGIEPGPELQRIQAAILQQDRTLGQDVAMRTAGPEVCPYKGLARFERADADFFFGREQAVADGIARLVTGSFLGLIGASGSGKSSLLRAGIVHALEGGAVPGSDGWTYALIRPGRHPLESLTQVFASTADGSPHGDIGQMLSPASSSQDGRFVLAVDQFEEVFTACDDEEERRAFLDAITEPALNGDGRVALLLAMRADHYGRCAEHRGLAGLLATSQLLVGPMSSEELHRAIELPAERAGLRVDPELADALVQDVGDRAGGLPLLSTALLELWQRRRDGTLKLDEYRLSGGVRGAVAHMADEAFGRLDPLEQRAARRILMRLAGPGRVDEVVGRRASLTELDLDRDPSASRALAVLTDARLVTVSEGTIEVAHEALFREWPRLRDWLEEDAEGRRLHQHLAGTATTWDESGRDAGDLYRGARLAAALDWSDAHEPDLNEVEREFLSRSSEVSEGEAARSRQTNRRLRGLLAGVALLLVLALIVGSLALKQRDEAQAASDVADSRQLAATSLTEKNLIVSLLLAREAVALDDSAQTRSALLEALQRDPVAIAEMHADGAVPGDLTEWLRLSPDGHIIATGGARTTVDLFDAMTYQPIGAIDVGAETTSGDFSPDGATLAVAAVDHRIVGIDMNARKVRASVMTRDRDIDALLFAPEDDRLFTAESAHEQGFLIPRDPVTLEPTGIAVQSESGPITAMDFSADGGRLVTTGLLPFIMPGPAAYTTLWRTRDLHQLAGPFRWGGNDVALSSDGQTAAIAASASADGLEDGVKGHLVLLNLRTGRTKISPQGRPHLSGPSLGLTGVTYSADGRSVFSTGDDHRVLTWDASSATEEEEAFDDPAQVDVFTPVLSPDGNTLFTIDADGDIVAWDLTGGQSLGRPFTAGSGAARFGFPWFAVSPDGGTLAIVQNLGYGKSGSVRLVDTSTMESLGVLPLPSGTLFLGLAFGPDNETLALTSGDYVQLWDVRTREPEGPPFAVPVGGTDEPSFWATAFSPDGSMLATAGDMGPGCLGGDRGPCHGIVFLWHVATGQLITRLPNQERTVNAVNFSPDGRLLVASEGIADGGDAIVWNVNESRVELTIPADDSGLWWADISTDGTTLVTGGQSSGERFWSLSTGDPIGSPISSEAVNTVDLSSDGRTLVAAGRGWVTVRDVGTESILGGSWFPGVGAKDQLAALFSPDGHRLFIVSETGDAWVWDVDPASWERRACQIAGRSLTQAEWQLYLPDQPYVATCGS